MSFRVTPEFKEKLDLAAQQSGRSLAQEIELRLERSLDEERNLVAALELGLGRQVAGLMLAVGFAINEAAPPPLPGQLDWLSDPEAFRVVAESVGLLLQTIAPDGNPKAWASLSEALHSKEGIDGEGRAADEGPIWAAVVAALAVTADPNYPHGATPRPLASIALKWLGEAVAARIRHRLGVSSSEEE